jgi:hypothetical protein
MGQGAARYIRRPELHYRRSYEEISPGNIRIPACPVCIGRQCLPYYIRPPSVPARGAGVVPHLAALLTTRHRRAPKLP